MSTESLSVEVFRNGTVARDALYDTEVSLQRLNRMFGGISIVGMTRTLGLATNNQGGVDVYRTPWSDFPAHINLVLSDKRIADTREGVILGQALNDNQPGGLRVAVVDSKLGLVEETVKHEFAHLVDMEHCHLRQCTMHAFQTFEKKQSFCHSCKRRLGRNILRNAARNSRLAAKAR